MKNHLTVLPPSPRESGLFREPQQITSQTIAIVSELHFTADDIGLRLSVKKFWAWLPSARLLGEKMLDLLALATVFY